MQFAVVLPWWGYTLAWAAALALAWLAYARVPTALTAGMRTLLTALRALTLMVLIAILLRPVVPVPPSEAGHILLPVVVDVSRSMRLDAGDGRSRLERAQEIVRALQSELGAQYDIELLTFGEDLLPGDVDRLLATGRRTDLSGAMAAVADRYRDTALAGVVLISDGGDTAAQEPGEVLPLPAPLMAVGVGQAGAGRDREIVNLTVGEPILSGSSVDLSVSAAGTGFGIEPIEFRVTANGRPVDVRRVAPAAPDAPVHAVFTVSPDPAVPTVYAVEVPVADGELTGENNIRSVLVPPQTGRKTVLIVEGAPGYEHSFLKRALAQDPGLDVDAVVRKGQNDDGRDTFYVQAGGDRVAALTNGYPSTRSALFVYDAIVFGNIEADFFTRDQLQMTSDFVAARGGGLLVLGARSFDRQGLAGTAIEMALPVDLTDRRGAVARVSAELAAAAPNTPHLTDDGSGHAATRLAVSAEESRRRWSALPPLASVSAMGGPRPGAQVLVVAAGGGLPVQPLVAAQRFGQGRSMVFGGEASWRWRMMRPASDTTYESVWRQMVRWVTAGSTGPVSIAPISPGAPGAIERIAVSVRDEAYLPIANADVRVRVTAPDGRTRQLPPALPATQDGRYRVAALFEQPGVYRVDATAERAGRAVGTATRHVLVGGTDLEMAQPRLNAAVLQRLAAGHGGTYVQADDAGTLPSLIRASTTAAGATEYRDLWHNGWSLLLVVGLLAAEWVARRRVGLS